MNPASSLSGIRSFSGTQINEIMESLLSLRDRTGALCIDNIGKERLFNAITAETLSQITKELQNYDMASVDIIEFVKIFLGLVDHEEHERIYLIASIVEFFKEMSERMDFAATVSAKEISTFIVESYMEKNLPSYSIPTKQLPEKKHFKVDPTKVRDIDVDAPIVYGETSIGLKRQDPTKVFTDSYHHANPIKEAYFSKELAKLFCLDSLSEKIIIYKESDVEKVLKPKSSRKNDSEIILHFAFSERTKRVGACLKNFSISFWDWSDKFSFEKNINTSLEVHDYQIKIWYLEVLDFWVTTDESATLYIWDLLHEQVTKKITTKFEGKSLNKRAITDLAEIDYLRFVAVSSSDKQINIWDFQTSHIIISLNMLKGGVHQIKYFKTYQLLITAGYENTIPIFSVTPRYNDLNLLGRLIGHLSVVTSITTIEGSPVVISSDDSGVVKTWDIRTQRCLQTVELGQRTVINKLVVLDSALAVLGSRVTFIEFDDRYASDEHRQESIYPIKAEYNPQTDEIMICSRPGIRIIDVRNGRTKRIFRSFFSKEEEEELTLMRFQQKSKKYILGNHKGNLRIFNYGSGEPIGKLEGHSLEVNLLKIDYLNKLVVTCGRDNALKIQRELSETSDKLQAKNDFENEEKAVALASALLLRGSDPSSMVLESQKIKNSKRNENQKRKNLRELSGSLKREKNENGNNKGNNREYEVFRVLKNINSGKEITAMEVSVYHNVIAVSCENKITLVDYEYLRPLGEVCLPEKEEISSLCFINGYGLLLVGTSKGLIHCLVVKAKENSLEEVKMVGFFRLGEGHIEVPNNFLVDFNFKEEKNRIRRKLTTNLGGVEKNHEKEANRTRDQSLKTSESISSPQQHQEDAGHGEDEIFIPSKVRLAQSLVPLTCEVFVSETKGNVHRLDLMPFILSPDLNLKIEVHTSCRSNYNPFRNANEKYQPPIRVFDFSEPNEDSPELKEKFLRVLQFKAHKDSLSSISFLFFPSKYILTTSLDFYLKIFTVSGVCQCSINVNHPLPMKWFLPEESRERARQKMVFALKVADSLFKRNFDSLYSDQLLLGLQKFLLTLMEDPKNITKHFTLSKNDELLGGKSPRGFSDSLAQNTQKMHQAPLPSNKNSPKKANRAQVPLLKSLPETQKPEGTAVALMKDEYSPRDLQFEKVKGMYEEEIQGSTLKQMDQAKKLINAQKQWKEEAQILEKNEQQQQLSQAANNKLNRNGKAPFFSEGFKKNEYRPKNKYAYELMRKLEQMGNQITKEQMGLGGSISQIGGNNSNSMGNFGASNRQNGVKDKLIHDFLKEKDKPKGNKQLSSNDLMIGLRDFPKLTEESTTSIKDHSMASLEKIGGIGKSKMSLVSINNRNKRGLASNKRQTESTAGEQEETLEEMKKRLNFFDYASERLGIQANSIGNSPKHSQKASFFKEMSLKTPVYSPEKSRLKAAGKSLMVSSSVASSLNESRINGLEEKSMDLSHLGLGKQVELQGQLNTKAEKKMFRIILEDMNFSIKKSQNSVFNIGKVNWAEVRDKRREAFQEKTTEMSIQGIQRDGVSKKEDTTEVSKDYQRSLVEIKELTDTKVFRREFTADEQRKIIETLSQKQLFIPQELQTNKMEDIHVHEGIVQFEKNEIMRSDIRLDTDSD